MFPVDKHTHFLTLAGSQAHGTAREGSDIDLRGICIAPMSTRLSLFERFEQIEGVSPKSFSERLFTKLRHHPTAYKALDGKVECVIYDIAKFLSLCAAANPNALEILFADERDWIFETPTWIRIYKSRHIFLTKKVQQTFLGYAMAQLKKIKTHRSWLLNPPKEKPVRTEYGLPSMGSKLSRDEQNKMEQGISDKIREYNIDNLEMPKSLRIAIQARMDDFMRDVLAVDEELMEGRIRSVASHALGLPSETVSALNSERQYRAALNHWDAYQAWKNQRNPARAELERVHGYDTKHAMHLIRLMRMGLEVLKGEGLHVRREDAQELLNIRDGHLTFEELLLVAVELQEAMEHASTITQLPADIAQREVDDLLSEILLR